MTVAFEVVVAGVLGIGVLGAVLALLGSRRTWEAYGRDHMLRDGDLDPRTPAPTGAVAAREREAEIRQMLEARNARRRRRGEPAEDVEAELARLAAPARARPGVDPELETEIRELVLARHRRQARRTGSPAPAPTPADIEAEVSREIDRLTS